MINGTKGKLSTLAGLRVSRHPDDHVVGALKKRWPEASVHVLPHYATLAVGIACFGLPPQPMGSVASLPHWPQPVAWVLSDMQGEGAMLTLTLMSPAAQAGPPILDKKHAARKASH